MGNAEFDDQTPLKSHSCSFQAMQHFDVIAPFNQAVPIRLYSCSVCHKQFAGAGEPEDFRILEDSEVNDEDLTRFKRF